MKLKLLNFPFLTFVLFAANLLYAQKISYKISPTKFENKPALAVKAIFPTNNQESLDLLYRNEFWGESNLKDHLKNFEILTKKAHLIDTTGDTIKLSLSKKTKEIEINYKIISTDYKELNFNNFFRPFISDSNFHILNFCLFVTPKLKDDDKIDVEISWENFDKDFNIHNSFGTNQKEQRIKNIAFKKFYESIFLGGNYKINQLKINNKNVTFVSPTNWVEFRRDSLMQLSKQILTEQINFWNDQTNTPYSIILTPEHKLKKEAGASYLGTGLTNSFQALISDNGKLNNTDILDLVNHEVLHHWIGSTIINENEEQQYWFSEGFTEYYNLKLAYKKNIIGKNAEHFISKFNEAAYRLNISPKAEIPNSEMNYDNFWNKKGYQIIPYYRGSIFAFYLDVLIQKESENKYCLDDLMRDFLKDAINNNQKMNEAYFIEKATKYYPEIKSLVQKYIIEGKLIPLKNFYNENNFEFKARKVEDLTIEVPILLKNNHNSNILSNLK